MKVVVEGTFIAPRVYIEKLKNSHIGNLATHPKALEDRKIPHPQLELPQLYPA